MSVMFVTSVVSLESNISTHMKAAVAVVEGQIVVHFRRLILRYKKMARIDGNGDFGVVDPLTVSEDGRGLSSDPRKMQFSAKYTF